MNVAFFLHPKVNVVCLTLQSTMRQALERMEYHRFTAVPILDHDGKYVGTLTEGDLLWKLKNTPGLSFENTHKICIDEVHRHMVVEPIHIYAEIEDLLSLAIHQNFVPVVDDQEIFIGIIRRSDIIEYFSKKVCTENELLSLSY